MRGTVKHGGCGQASAMSTASIKEEVGGGGMKMGGRRSKTNNAHMTTTSTVSGGVTVKQEPCDIKIEPGVTSRSSSPSMNGDDPPKSSVNSSNTNSNNGTKVKLEITNGSGLETAESKPSITSLSTSNSTTVTTSSSSCTSVTVTSPSVGGEAEGNIPGVDGSTCSGGKFGSYGVQSSAGVATSDAQYMQQQSQIFVFSTSLANKAADAVIHGHFPNIIAFHCSQPATKKLLDKHPMKINQFGRQNPSQWINSFMMKGGKNSNMKNSSMSHPMGAPHMGPIPPDMGPVGPHLNHPSGQSQCPDSITQSGMMCGGIGSPGMIGGPSGPGMMIPRPNMMMGPGPGIMPSGSPNCSPMMGPGVVNPSLQGVKVPDDHLTPEQRKHREERMAQIRNMQAFLFHDMQPSAEASPPSVHPNSSVPSCSLGPQVSGSATSCPNANSMISCSPGQQQSTPCGQSTPVTGMGPSPAPCMGPSPGLGPNPNMGPSPSLGPSPGMGPSPGLNNSSGMGSNSGMGHSPVMNPASSMAANNSLGPNMNPCNMNSMNPMIGPGTGHMGSNMMMPQGNNNMMMPQPNMMGGPGCPMGPSGPSMRVMGPGGPQVMMMGGPNPNTPMVAQMAWQRMQADFFESKRKKGNSGNNSNGREVMVNMMGPGMAGPDGTMMPMGPMCSMAPNISMGSVGGPMINNPMMSGPVSHGGQISSMGPGISQQMCPTSGAVCSRVQGPPPPYQGPRPVGNGPVMSPGSPSLCSLSSPRMPTGTSANPVCSGVKMTSSSNSGCPSMDSPRSTAHSNPATPVAGVPITSPSLKEQPSTPKSATSDVSFGRQLQSFTQQQQNGASLVPGQGSGVPCQQQNAALSSCQQQQNPAMVCQQQQQGVVKEASLMPVPSPQQIQYLSNFEGQELTIQKQPNTSLRESDMMSPLSGVDTSTGDSQGSQTRISGSDTPLGTTTPHTPSSEPASRAFSGSHTPDHFPVPSPGITLPSTPNTPQQSTPQDKTRSFPGPSPQGTTPAGGNTPTSTSSGGSKTPSLESGRFTVPSPKTPGVSGSTTPVGTELNPRFPVTSPVPSATPVDVSGVMTGGRFPGSCQTSSSNSGSVLGKINSSTFSMSPGKISSLEIGGDFNNSAAANLPLNPDCSTPGGLPAAPSGKHFDPISSMAQMSQQLTSGQSGGSPSGVPGPNLTLGPGPMVGRSPSGMMPNNSLLESPGNMIGIPPVSSSPTMITGNAMTSPVSDSAPRGASPNSLAMMAGPNPRMMNPNSMVRSVGPSCSMANYNGANIQVKPNAPNTIQYLPARPLSSNNQGPRGPPSLDFLPRFNNPGMEKVNPGMFPNSTTPNSLCGPNVPMSSMSMSGPCVGVSSAAPGAGGNAGMCTMSAGPSPMCSGSAPGGPMCSVSSGPAGPMCSTVSGPMCTMPGPMPMQSGQVVGNMNTMAGPNGPFPISVVRPNVPMGMAPSGPMGGPMTGMGGPMGGPNGPMMGPGGPIMGHNGPMGMNPNMMPGSHIGPNGQVMVPRGGNPMLRGPTSASVMGGMGEVFPMNSMNSGPGMPSGPMSGRPGPSPGVPTQMMNSGPMYGPKGSPVGVNMGMTGPMGGTGDTAQPLPPSMGQSGNFKNNQFVGPTTADPTYAAQYHNFQQQLYATGTRSGATGPMPPHMGVPMGHVGHGGMVPGPGSGGPPPGMPGGVMGGPPMGPQGFPFNPK